MACPAIPSRETSSQYSQMHRKPHYHPNPLLCRVTWKVWRPQIKSIVERAPAPVHFWYIIFSENNTQSGSMMVRNVTNRSYQLCNSVPHAHAQRCSGSDAMSYYADTYAKYDIDDDATMMLMRALASLSRKSRKTVIFVGPTPAA